MFSVSGRMDWTCTACSEVVDAVPVGESTRRDSLRVSFATADELMTFDGRINSTTADVVKSTLSFAIDIQPYCYMVQSTLSLAIDIQPYEDPNQNAYRGIG